MVKLKKDVSQSGISLSLKIMDMLSKIAIQQRTPSLEVMPINIYTYKINLMQFGERMKFILWITIVEKIK